MATTTIQITTQTKKMLDSIKKYRRETYNDVINRLLEEAGHLKKKEKTLQTNNKEISRDEYRKIVEEEY